MSERLDSILANPRSDRVRSVRALSRRSSRQRQGLFAAEGPQAVGEALRAVLDRAAGPAGERQRVPVGIESVYLTHEFDGRRPEFAQWADAAGVLLRWTTPEVMSALSDAATPQGVLAVVRTPVEPELTSVLVPDADLLAVMVRTRDPGNAGTAIRIADAAGADAVLFSTESVDILGPKVVRSTAGSLFHLPVMTSQPVADVVGQARSAGFVVLAADGGGRVDLDELVDRSHAAARGEPIDGIDLRGPTVWLFGNEAHGMASDELALVDEVVRIPIHGDAESLNLAVAVGVALYASAHAQGLRRRRP